MEIRMDKGGLRVIDHYKRIRDNLKKEANKDLRKVAVAYQRELRRGIRQQKLLFTYTMYKSVTKPPTKVAGGYNITMPIYSEWLDKMKPHSVIVKGKPLLERWVKEKTGRPLFTISVRAHPFIHSAIERGHARLEPTLEEGHVHKLIKEVS